VVEPFVTVGNDDGLSENLDASAARQPDQWSKHTDRDAWIGFDVAHLG